MRARKIFRGCEMVHIKNSRINLLEKWLNGGLQDATQIIGYKKRA